MGKLIKPLVIIQLLVSIGALYLGYELFKQREVLKGRTQKLETASVNFAKKIRYDNFDKKQIMNYETMDVALSRLATAGDNLYDDLQLTKQDLENTRQDLAQTRNELSNTKADLSDARNEIARLNDTITRKDGEIAQANSKIDDLNSEVDGLKGEIENLNLQVAEREEQIAELEANYASLERDYQKLVGEFEGTRGPKGLVGRVVLVNKDWNFVVLDIGSELGLVPDAEMLVQRSDELVGKVRVQTVEDHLAVAEIVPDWEKQPLQKGDYVISPEG